MFYILSFAGHTSSFLFATIVGSPSPSDALRAVGRHGAAMALLSSSWLLPPTRRLGALCVASVAVGAAAVDAWR